MNCRDVEERLDDYVDGIVPDAEAAEVKRHLEGCEACRQGELELRSLLTQATALPGEAKPDADLWPGIRQRILRSNVVHGYFEGLPPRAWRPAVAAAAGLLIIVSTALAGYLLGRRSAADEAQAPRTRSVQLDPAAPHSLFIMETEFAEARQDLLKLLEQRKDSLTPKTLAMIQDNLRLIDQSLSEIRIALEQDPANPDLARLLAATYRGGVDLLQRANSWSARM